MTNEEKSQEISEKNKHYHIVCSSLDCFLSAMDMAKWKDEQIKQLIRYADKMYGAAFNLGPVGQGETLRKAMEEYKQFKNKEIYK